MHMPYETEDDVRDVPYDELTNWGMVCPYKLAYTVFKEEAEQRLLNVSAGGLNRAFKLLRYVEHRAMRERGYVV